MNVIQVSQYSLADTAAKVYGSTGVVVGTWAGTMSIDGKDASGAFRFTDTFVKNGDRWQVVASQDTRLPGPPIP